VILQKDAGRSSYVKRKMIRDALEMPVAHSEFRRLVASHGLRITGVRITHP